jgi:ACS family D-galactonate transporter-like MFS transporter
MNRRWVVLGFIFAAILISYVDRGNLSIAETAIMQDFHLPPASMGLLLSAFFWTYAAFQIPAGMLIDRFGIRSTYAAAFLLWSTASAATALSNNSTDILLLRLLLGLAEAIGPVASLAFIRQNFSGREQGLPVSIYVSGQTLGPACGASLGSVLLASFGWRPLFAVTGLAALLWVPGWYWLAPKRPRQSATEAAIRLKPSLQWSVMFTSRAFWALSACVFFFSYYWYFVLTWMPAYLILARKFSTLAMGGTLSVPLFIMAATNLIAGWLADRLVAKTGSVFRVRMWFTVAGLAGAALILLLDLLPNRAAVLPVLIMSICSFGVASSQFWSIAQYTPPASLVGRTIGYLNTLSQIGGIAAPLVTGWSLGPQKNFAFAISLAGIAPAIACFLLFVAGTHGLETFRSTLSSTAKTESV